MKKSTAFLLALVALAAILGWWLIAAVMASLTLITVVVDNRK